MKEKTTYLSLKDHSISGEDFQLVYNENLDLLETFPQPKADKLPEYYKSEDYISHTDAKRNLFEKVYHIIKSISLKRKLKLINSFSFTEKKLLDVGCGTGDFLKVAKDSNWLVSGIEPNAEARKIANKKTNNSVFEIEQLLKFKPHSFDVISLWHVLEHLPKLDEHIAVFEKLLKPDGVLIIAVPNYKSYDALHYKNYWAAFDVPRHLWHFSQTSISKLMANVNMSVVKTLPMKFDAFYVCLLSEKYKSGFINPIKGFWFGLLSNLNAKKTKEYSSLIYIIKKQNTNIKQYN
ncbi:class I SAM-dependent methyltransferase [Ichthyenterobacterium magnum]|uniref:Methyltransferase family protein n=1 Tax=Ichthyenterobacterium magnum TaxID=1230530 RepID=A0A420DX59_9FLAO|nr:class I SAM-dependent methyltransferase [Ichthyenterobacterium magnum]RKE98805.1 methyltransferase family protein [Ichthyenterobacterium magnum]